MQFTETENSMPTQVPEMQRKRRYTVQFPDSNAVPCYTCTENSTPTHVPEMQRNRRYAIQFPHSNAVHYSSTENSMPTQVPDIQRKRRYAMQFPDSSWKATQCSSLIYPHCKHRMTNVWSGNNLTTLIET